MTSWCGHIIHALIWPQRDMNRDTAAAAISLRHLCYFLCSFLWGIYSTSCAHFFEAFILLLVLITLGHLCYFLCSFVRSIYDVSCAHFFAALMLFLVLITLGHLCYFLCSLLWGIYSTSSYCPLHKYQC